MRHALALLCPPLALLISRRPVQAVLASILLVAAIVTIPWGVGVFLDLGLILWAINAVSDDQAGREVRAFIKTVKPIPVIHE